MPLSETIAAHFQLLTEFLPNFLLRIENFVRCSFLLSLHNYPITGLGTFRDRQRLHLLGLRRGQDLVCTAEVWVSDVLPVAACSWAAVASAACAPGVPDSGACAGAVPEALPEL